MRREREDLSQIFVKEVPTVVTGEWNCTVGKWSYFFPLGNYPVHYRVLIEVGT